MKKVKRVRIIIFKDAQILLLKKEEKRHYTFPGGVVKSNESLKSTLIREIKEEIGAEVKKSDLKRLATMSFEKNGEMMDNYYYILNQPERFDYKLLEPFKFSELSWLNIIKASKHLKYNEKFIVDDILLKSYPNNFNDFINQQV